MLRTDATLEATPFRDWQAGRAKCIHMLDAYVLGAPGDWRMIATTANGQPAAVVYHRDADGALRAHGIVVLAPTATGVSRVIEFHDPALVSATAAAAHTSRGGPRAQLDPAHDLVARAGDPLPPASAPAAERDEFVDQRERVVVGAGFERGHRRPRARGFRRGEGE